MTSDRGSGPKQRLQHGDSLDVLASDVLNTLVDEIAVLDETGHIVATNEAWREFASENDLAAGSLEGTDYLAAVNEVDGDEFADAAASGLRAVLAGDRESFELEYPCHSPTERRWFTMRVRPLEREDERFVVVTHTDVTDRRLAEDEVARTATELSADREQLALLNQVVRHDIRNDMSVVLGEAELLREDVADEAIAAGLDRIAAKARHVVGLTDAVRELSDLITDEADPDLRPVALAPTLRAEAEKVTGSRWSGVESVSLTGVEDLPDVRVLATDLLASVFGNLLSNAVLHNDRATPSVDVSVAVDEETVTVSVADEGPGIPDDLKGQVVGRGEKGIESPGSGLGLYLVDELVDLYGGDLAIRDNDPRGTVVDVTLRRADPE